MMIQVEKKIITRKNLPDSPDSVSVSSFIQHTTRDGLLQSTGNTLCNLHINITGRLKMLNYMFWTLVF